MTLRRHRRRPLLWVCWDAAECAHVKPRAEAAEKAPPGTAAGDQKPKRAAAAAAARQGDDWLARAQEHMTDAAVLREQLAIGKLYRAGERKAKASASGLDDADARACFEAYRQAIDRGKHGDERDSAAAASEGGAQALKKQHYMLYLETV